MAFTHVRGIVIKKELRNGSIRVDTGCIAAFSSVIEYDVQPAGNL